MKFMISLVGLLAFVGTASGYEFYGLKRQRQNPVVIAPGAGQGDSVLVQAVRKRRGVNFLQAQNLQVIQILPDDRQGREHQKFVVRLSDGSKVTAVYNLDMCERVPVKIGDQVGLAGQFIWTKQGGLVHWLHHDPSGRRPDGYVLHEGKSYCN